MFRLESLKYLVIQTFLNSPFAPLASYGACSDASSRSLKSFVGSCRSASTHFHLYSYIFGAPETIAWYNRNLVTHMSNLGRCQSSWDQLPGPNPLIRTLP